MCHLILLLPVVSLPVFWLLPPAQSIPLYAGVLGLSLWVYGYLLKAMHRPVQTGAEALVGREGVVVERDGGKILVRVASETWVGHSRHPVAVGDRVRVVARDGLHLVLEAAATGGGGPAP